MDPEGFGTATPKQDRNEDRLTEATPKFMDEMMRELPAKLQNLMTGKDVTAEHTHPAEKSMGADVARGTVCSRSPQSRVVDGRTIADRLTPPGGGQGADEDKTPPALTVRGGLCGTQVRCVSLLDTSTADGHPQATRTEEHQNDKRPAPTRVGCTTRHW